MNAPTLLIGLGGTGCKIIERVSKMVTGEQRNNIAFAVFILYIFCFIHLCAYFNLFYSFL